MYITQEECVCDKCGYEPMEYFDMLDAQDMRNLRVNIDSQWNGLSLEKPK
jgi:hypothetical protein